MPCRWVITGHITHAIRVPPGTDSNLEVERLVQAPNLLRVLSWKEAAAFVHLWPTHLISLVDPDDADLLASSPRPDLIRLELFVGDVTDPGHPHAATEQDVARIVAFGGAWTTGPSCCATVARGSVVARPRP